MNMLTKFALAAILAVTVVGTAQAQTARTRQIEVLPAPGQAAAPQQVAQIAPAVAEQAAPAPAAAPAPVVAAPAPATDGAAVQAAPAIPAPAPAIVPVEPKFVAPKFVEHGYGYRQAYGYGNGYRKGHCH